MSSPATRSRAATTVRRTRWVFLVLLAALLSTTGCSGDESSEAGPSDTSTSAADSTSGGTDGDRAAPATPIVLNGQGNHLDAWSIEGGGTASQRVVTSAAADPEHGIDINAQICVFESGGRRMMIAGEDTGQPDPPAGWGIFELSGDAVGNLSVEQVAKLTPTYQQADADKPENYGCAVLDDGRILTTDIGDQVEGANGQLILWFPPFDGRGEGDIAYCKLDVALPGAQSILLTGEETFLVAAVRGGIYEFSGPLPTDDTPEGGCDSTDATGRPLATGVPKRLLVEPGADGMATPAGLAHAPDDGFFASSVFSGVINEYDGDGSLRRSILSPPEGEVIADEPYSTGTPLGLVTDSLGNLWYADIGLVIDGSDVGPGEETGSLRVIRFEAGTPEAPVVVGDGLAFPDGLGTFTP